MEVTCLEHNYIAGGCQRFCSVSSLVLRARSPFEFSVPPRQLFTPLSPLPHRWTPSRAIPSTLARLRPASRPRPFKSEEHTSELQSHLNLVCRLLLEKKKKMKKPRHPLEIKNIHRHPTH